MASRVYRQNTIFYAHGWPCAFILNSTMHTPCASFYFLCYWVL